MDVIDNSPFKEGVPLGVGFGTLTLLKNAPHPNAAKVFIDWYLSRKAQTALQKDMASTATHRTLSGSNSRRTTSLRTTAGSRVNYTDVFRSEWTDMNPVYAVVDEALAEAERKSSGK